eukprot:529400-Rhodomonas_salina.1
MHTYRCSPSPVRIPGGWPGKSGQPVVFSPSRAYFEGTRVFEECLQVVVKNTAIIGGVLQLLHAYYTPACCWGLTRRGITLSIVAAFQGVNRTSKSESTGRQAVLREVPNMHCKSEKLPVAGPSSSSYPGTRDLCVAFCAARAAQNGNQLGVGLTTYYCSEVPG